MKRLKSRVGQALQQRRLIEPILTEVYRYVLPYRAAGTMTSPGEANVDELFDATGVDGAFRFAGRMQQALTPEGFFALEAGPVLDRMPSEDKREITLQLEDVARTVSAALKTSDFDLATHEMYTDLFAGTGAMMMIAGDEQQPIRCVSAPAMELALERSPYGQVGAIHWIKKFPAYQLPEMWPRAKWDDDTARKIAEYAETPIEVCQSTVWNNAIKRWELTIFKWSGVTVADGDDVRPVLPVELFRTCPWIVPRFWVVPGEVWGRGPGMIALPFLKTLNKAQELDLKGAALALFGIYTQADDGVFNPSTARFEPGAIWQVRANGGVLGKSIERLEVPGRYDLSRFVIEEQRAQANAVLFNKRLPPETGAVRSPTEIMERIRDIDLDMSGIYGRLKFEIIVPIVRRAMEILESLQQLQTKLTIDQITVGIRVVSPAARAKAAADAKPIVDYATLLGSIVGPEMVGDYLEVDAALPHIGMLLGVEQRDLTGQRRRDEIRQQRAKAAQQQQAIEAVKAIPPDQFNPNGADV